MLCPRCRKNEAIIDPSCGVTHCLSCRKRPAPAPGQTPEFATITERDRIVPQRDAHAKDILQPWDGDKPSAEFCRAYPEYRDNYFTKEQLKKL